ncbi:MAG: thiolase family protein [Cryobacterium sp.]|nr:thiolase family protein [Cryobacterium sp.]
MTESVYVVGVGITPFGKFADESMKSLGRTASRTALIDAGISPRDIDLVSAGSARSGMLHGHESGVGQMVAWELGISGVAVYNVKAYCASGSSAFNVAYMALAGGFNEVALVVGVEQLSVRAEKGRPITSDGVEIESDFGFTPPAFFAAVTQEHMREFGTTREQLAAVAVKNRANAVHNPVAQYRNAISIDDVINSPNVSGPLNLFDCCPTGDGAAALVLMTESAVKRLKVGDRAIRIASSVVRSGEYEQVKSLTTFNLDVLASKQAYEKAGLGPEDLDVVEVHDAFTITELIHIEDLGLVAKGESGPAVARGEFSLGGRIPVSTSGGLLTKGHPLGASGTAQLVELVEQLRGESGVRQVDGAKVAMAQMSGGFMESDLATSCITILTR